MMNDGMILIFTCVGIIIGHIYFFLEDVFPLQPNGFKILKTPAVLYVKRVVYNKNYINKICLNILPLGSESL